MKIGSDSPYLRKNDATMRQPLPIAKSEKRKIRRYSVQACVESKKIATPEDVAISD
jgi:hypothetical protein